MPAGVYARRPISERFWEKVLKSDDCWLWAGNTNDHGYGLLGMNGHNRYAHRIAWELTYGAIPIGMSVLHHCDNPPCVRPSHLFLGTQADNIADMDAKNRRKATPMPGELNGRAKLTWRDVSEIKRELSMGGVIAHIAKRYSVSHTVISQIKRKLRWRSNSIAELRKEAGGKVK